MKLRDPELQESLIQRLRRIEGQIRGVEGMLEQQRDCKEILQQVSAVQAALRSFSRLLLEEYAVTCLLDEDARANPHLAEKNLRELIELISKAQ